MTIFKIYAVRTILFYFLIINFSCKKKDSSSLPISNTKFQKNQGVIYDSILNNISEGYKSLIGFSTDSLKIPRSMEENGVLRNVSSSDWCSGFYPGIWWMLYSHNKDSLFLAEAEKWTKIIEDEKNNIYTHDLGFMIYNSFGLGYKETGKTYYKDVVVESAKSLAKRFDKKVGLIKSWDTPKGHKWEYPVIIDNMMNLELLFEASKITKDSMYYNIALEHANKTLKNHFREDFSSYHVVDYDSINGSVRKKETHQGISNESAWSRGQGWGLYGYTLMYRETNDRKYLEMAMHIADYIIKRLPEDFVPFWDFDDPNIPDAPKDASAGALYASSLLELQSYVNEEYKSKYLNIAKLIIDNLNTTKYRLKPTPEAPFILDHSTGNFPAGDEINVPIVYADYYFIEALLRAKNLEN